jgi:hypothetical protein
MNIEELRQDYGKALRAWHVAWLARAGWHRELREAEERAYDRFLCARDVLSEALRTEGATGA